MGVLMLTAAFWFTISVIVSLWLERLLGGSD